MSYSNLLYILTVILMTLMGIEVVYYYFFQNKTNNGRKYFIYEYFKGIEKTLNSIDKIYTNIGWDVLWKVIMGFKRQKGGVDYMFMPMQPRNIEINDVNDIFNALNIDHAGIMIDIIDHDNAIINLNRNQVDLHDHATQNSIVKSYSNLKQWIDNNKDYVISNDESIKQIKEYLFKKYKTENIDNIEKAYSVIKSMMKKNGHLVSINKNELDVLAHVWSRINAPINKEVREELVNNLIEQLTECSININMDHARCLTGRISRIIQSLESIDKENIVNITSVEMVKNELNNKIPVLIENYTVNWSHEQQDKYDNGNIELADKLRSHIHDELFKDYVKCNIFKPDTFETLIKPYLNEI